MCFYEVIETLIHIVCLFVALISESSDASEIDVTFVMQFLSGESIKGLPPGGGLHAK